MSWSQLLLVLLAATALLSCRAPEPPPKRSHEFVPNPDWDSEQTVPGMPELTWRPIEKPVAGQLDATSFIVTRCVFRDADGTILHLPMSADLALVSPDIRDEVEIALARYDTLDVDLGEDVQSERAYQLSVKRNVIFDLDVVDSDRASIRTVEGSLLADAPALTARLRNETLEALVAAMRRPARPLFAHFRALAGFLDDLANDSDDAKRVRTSLLEGVAEFPDLARDLVKHLGSFSSEELATVPGRGPVPVQVLRLAARARDGSKEAVGELLVLSLEFHSEAVLFAEALERVIPRDKNLDFYTALAPVTDRTSATAVLEALRVAGERATYSEELGWRIE